MSRPITLVVFHSYIFANIFRCFLAMIRHVKYQMSMSNRSAGDSVPETLVPAFSRGRQLVSFRYENRLLVPEHRNWQQQTCEYEPQSNDGSTPETTHRCISTIIYISIINSTICTNYWYIYTRKTREPISSNCHASASINILQSTF